MKNIPQTVGFKAGERNVFLHILTGCNLSCSHCYINPSQHGTNMLTRQQMEAWIRLFADSEKQTNIIFLGGEPTMHPDLVHGLRIARQCGFNITVDTNGFLFHDFLNRVSADLVDFLSFSLDGPDSEINDPIRGEGVFEVCTSNLKKAVARGFNVSLIYTDSSRNIEHLQRMVPLLAELGVRKFFIQVIGLRGKSAQQDDERAGVSAQVDPARWLEVVPGVAAAVTELGIEVIYPKVFLDKEEQFECAGNVAENFFVFPNGRVYQCPLCEDHPVHSYEIRENRLVHRTGLTEENFFGLNIAEGCVMNKLLQPDTITYDQDGTPHHRISCCLLKQRL
ncbi:MAG: radical SAM protein [Desulfocapsaceae bacterium]|jgi:MoaA/NifB/PqqE/SkfB family radical SAM enzyme|nr:radical SAM protein [Desulfocapsaceae bacterium]